MPIVLSRALINQMRENTYVVVLWVSKDFKASIEGGIFALVKDNYAPKAILQIIFGQASSERIQLCPMHIAQK